MENLTIEDTGLVYCNEKNKIYKILKDNNITNLEQLLNLSDKYKISIHARTKREFIGFLKIIRYKYLNESIDLISILDESPTFVEAGVDKGKYRFNNLFELGLDANESKRINQQMFKYGEDGDLYKLIDVLRYFYESHVGFNGKQTRIQLNKVKVLIDYYEKEQQNQKKKIKNR